MRDGYAYMLLVATFVCWAAVIALIALVVHSGWL